MKRQINTRNSKYTQEFRDSTIQLVMNGNKPASQVAKDLKRVYQATTKDIAEEVLLKLDERWGKKYWLSTLGIINRIIYQFISNIHQIYAKLYIRLI